MLTKTPLWLFVPAVVGITLFLTGCGLEIAGNDAAPVIGGLGILIAAVLGIADGLRRAAAKRAG